MKDLSSGMMLDKETMDRMGQLQQLLSEMLPRELQQSLAELRQKLEQQSPDMKRALEKFELDQEKLKESIDRALELLKKIAEEQRLEALARRPRSWPKAQEKLTERLGKEPSERSAQMEQDIEGRSGQPAEGDEGPGRFAVGQGDRRFARRPGRAGRAGEVVRTGRNELANQMRQGKPGESKPKSSKLAQDMKKLERGTSSP